jgi:hypothetical protein
MRKFLGQLLAVTVALAFLGFVAFAYIGDLSPNRTEVSQTVNVTLK